VVAERADEVAERADEVAERADEVADRSRRGFATAMSPRTPWLHDRRPAREVEVVAPTSNCGVYSAAGHPV
jgi:hypothetical protein